MKIEKTEAPAPAEICVRHLCKAYGETLACRDVDFIARSGTVTGLLGLNGAGKSTLLKILCGVQYATSGELSVCGETDSAAIRQLCSYVSEIPELDLSFTVKETLWERRAMALEQVRRAAAVLELEAVFGKKLRTLSKGYRQRVALAKALAADTQVLVLDEFSAGLDPAQIVRLREAIKEQAKEKIVILSTHRIEEALSLCGCIYILHKGSVAAHGSVEELLAEAGKQNLEEAFLCFTGMM